MLGCQLRKFLPDDPEDDFSIPGSMITTTKILNVSPNVLLSLQKHNGIFLTVCAQNIRALSPNEVTPFEVGKRIEI